MGWKEKDWKKNQRPKNDEDSSSEMKKEMLRMQGLIVCNECQVAYSLYQPKCPNCGESNKAHYPAKV
jgi:rRNA maturation protein Nop10